MPKAVFVALVLLPTVLLAQAQGETETDRLVATGKLWGTIKYFHPYLAYRDIDWDKALVDALPQIRSARTGAEYSAALRLMLDALHDPATYSIVEITQKPNAALEITKAQNGTLIISQTQSEQTPAGGIQQLVQAITSAKNVIFDLRVAPGEPDYLTNLLDDGALTRVIARGEVETSAQRSWIHNGLPPQVKTAVNTGYYSAFHVQAASPILGGSSQAEHKIAFILNENSPLPHVGCALWTQGLATVLAESDHFQLADARSAVIPMGLGVSAVVRLSEPVASRAVKIVSRDAAIAQALSALDNPIPAPVLLPLSTAPSARRDLTYSEMRYPSAEYRILAAYKIWAAFRNFFAYRDLMDEDWDEVFTTFLPRFTAAKDATEYNLTIAEMLTHAADSHATASSDELTEYFGQAPVGLRLRLIEKKPVVTEVLDSEAAKAAIHVGDIVTKVDGESITDRFRREARYTAGSTQQALGYAVVQSLLNGPEGSSALLSIEAPDGRTREVHLKRSAEYKVALTVQRSGEVVKVLPGNIGYADLDRLRPEEVDSMLDQLRSTNAIIFDLRGSSHGTGWLIAPRLTERHDVAAAIFNGPLSLAPDVPYGELTSSASYFFVQKLAGTDKWKYKGRTVMLIDERTISEAEHTGLLFEAANKTEFIGTTSAGADSDVTNFVVPGGVVVSFSGRDVRHANGGPVQRLGLMPGVTVAPTIKGTRGGRDEIQQKALEYLSPTTKGSPLHVAALRLFTDE